MNQKNRFSIKITETKLLLVEGKDEEFFFKTFLKKKEICNIQIISSGGKDKFKNKFPAIKNTPGFDEVTSLAVIHDADTNAQGAFQSICSVLKNNSVDYPKQISSFTTSNSLRVGVFIIPDGGNQGKLESLCLSTVESDSIIECIDSFMSCIKQQSQLDINRYKEPKDIHKARCRAFLSAMEEDIPSLGLAAEKGYWNLDSDKLNPMLNFLQELNRKE